MQKALLAYQKSSCRFNFVWTEVEIELFWLRILMYPKIHNFIQKYIFSIIIDFDFSRKWRMCTSFYHHTKIFKAPTRNHSKYIDSAFSVKINVRPSGSISPVLRFNLWTITKSVGQICVARFRNSDKNHANSKGLILIKIKTDKDNENCKRFNKYQLQISFRITWRKLKKPI